MALTLTTNDEIIRRCGAGAPVEITGVAATVTAIGEAAEGELIADTRRDWITGYASVNTNVKKKLSNAVAALAAIKIVSNDRTGYYSNLEQQTILDVLTNEYNQAVKTLSALDANNIRTVTE